MRRRCIRFTLALIGAVASVDLINSPPSALSVRGEEAKVPAPQVVLAETYNAVAGIYFTNIAVHKGSHKPGLIERRFRADVKYWLMDPKYYEQGELSIGNPPLVELVRELGSKKAAGNFADDAIRHGVRNGAWGPRSICHYSKD
jgi:hypothetical protein